MSAAFAPWAETVWSSGVASGIKEEGAEDLGLLVAERPMGFAGVFTQNAARAACVEWSQSLLGLPVRAVVANSGNANACTGASGAAAVETTAVSLAAEIGCHPEEVLVASTGPIGVPLDVGNIVAALPDAIEGLGRDPEPFARALMTTDTYPKFAAASGVGITGVAKGAAMIAPNMATMLAFLVTDAALEIPALQDELAAAVERTFNRISVDACESTNDSVFLLSTGLGSVPEHGAFAKGLDEVCGSLARQIVQDAEGATKVIRIVVSGAPDATRAVALGRAVAASDLWRAAAHGADPNWGRILAAMGAVDRTLDTVAVVLTIGGEVVFAGGEPDPTSLGRAAQAMSADEFEVTVALGAGDATAEVLTADLTADYVTLNAFGTT